MTTVLRIAVHGLAVRVLRKLLSISRLVLLVLRA